jgi:hypothetical protein
VTADHAAIFGDVIDRATRRCGPCVSGGAPVRDHLPERLTPAARAAILARLDRGEAEYGTKLRIGHEHAETEVGQEIFDGAAYAIAAGMSGPDLDWLCDAANRCAAGTFGRPARFAPRVRLLAVGRWPAILATLRAAMLRPLEG